MLLAYLYLRLFKHVPCGCDLQENGRNCSKAGLCVHSSGNRNLRLSGFLFSACLHQTDFVSVKSMVFFLVWKSSAVSVHFRIQPAPAICSYIIYKDGQSRSTCTSTTMWSNSIVLFPLSIILVQSVHKPLLQALLPQSLFHFKSNMLETEQLDLHH